MTHQPASRCRYHAEQPAHWHCPSCHLDLCKRCRPHAELLPIEIACPLCRQEMVEIDNPLDLRRELLAGLRRQATPVSIALITTLALAFAIAPAGSAGLLLAIPVLAVFGLWLAMTARHAGENRPTAPTMSNLTDIDELDYGLRTGVFAWPYFALLLLGLWLESAGIVLLSAIVTGVVLPASLMATLVRGKAGAGLTPELPMRIARRLRRSYLALAGLVLACVAAPALTGLALSGVLPAPLLGGVMAPTVAWLLLGCSHLIGVVLYRHRRILDYDAGVDRLDRPARPAAAVYEPALLAADADILLEERRVKAARLHLGEALTQYPDDPDLNQRFDQLVSEVIGPVEFRNHIERRLHRLVSRRQRAAAADLWQRFSPRLGDWLPRNSLTRYQLALELDLRGEHSTAFRLLIKLTRGEPGFDQVAEAWLEAARILDEHLDDPEKARQLRQVVVQRYPDRARKWLARWQQPQARPGPAASAAGQPA